MQQIRFEPAKFRFGDSYFKTIASGYEEHTELVALFKKELDEGEARRREIELKLVGKKGSSLNDDGLEIGNGSSTQQEMDIKVIKTNKKIRGTKKISNKEEPVTSDEIIDEYIEEKTKKELVVTGNW